MTSPLRLLLALSEAAAERPGRVLALGAVLLVLLIPPALRLETDNSPETFFPRDHESLARFEAFGTVFDPGRTIRVALSGDKLWSAAGIAWSREVEGILATVPGVTEASGLGARHGSETEPSVDPEALREWAVASPLARGLGWISADGDVASVLVRISPETPVSEIVPALESTLRSLVEPGRSLEMVGLPVLEHALDRSSAEIVTRFFPLLVAVTSLLLFLTLGGWREVAVALLYVTFCLAVLLGAFRLVGGTLNLVLTVLPPVLFVIALAVAIHLLIRFRDLRSRGVEAPRAIRDTMSEKGRAVFWTGATTLVGFASLASAPVAPVRTLGVAAASGITIVTLAAFTLLPALLRTLGGDRRLPGRDRDRSFERRSRALARRAAMSAVARPRATLLGAALLGLAALLSIPSLTVASNALEYLPRTHALHEAVRKLEARGLPSAAVEIVLESPAGAPRFDSPEGLRRLAEITADLESVSGARTAVSAGTLLEEARRTIGGAAPFVDDALLLEGLWRDPRGRALLSRSLSPTGDRARVSLGVRLGGYPELDRMTADVRRRVEAAWPGLGVHPTGEYLLLLETQRSLLRTLGSSLAISLLVIGAIFLFLLRSPRLAVIALAPNVWPVVLVLGVMAWAGTPLDVATVMVAAVVLGLAVDDTIHTLLLAAPRGGGSGGTGKIVAAVAANGPAYTLTSLLLAAGFGVCALSDFAPTARFGMLAALAMVLVWAGALWGLPALLTLDRPRPEARSSPHNPPGTSTR